MEQDGLKQRRNTDRVFEVCEIQQLERQWERLGGQGRRTMLRGGRCGASSQAGVKGGGDGFAAGADSGHWHGVGGHDQGAKPSGSR